MPSPKKESPISAMAAEPSASNIHKVIIPRRLGSMWKKIILEEEAPKTLAASIYGISLNLRVSERIILADPIQKKREKTKIIIEKSNIPSLINHSPVPPRE